jgi:hypothetical protein
VLLAILFGVALAGLFEWRRVHARGLLAWSEILDEAQLMDAAIQAHQLTLIDGQETKLHAAAERLVRARWIAGARSPRLQATVLKLATAAADTHSAADAGDQRGAELELRHTRRVLTQVRQLLPHDLRALSATAQLQAFVCAMHPEAQSPRPGRCPRCGMPFEPRDRATRAPYVTMRIAAAAPLRVGTEARVEIALEKSGGAPLTLGELLEVHTRKIHLLIVDASLVDYHHEHPVATATPGHFAFSFTPRKPGSYRVWADLLPAATEVQELPVADLAGEGTGAALPDHAPRLVDVVDGMRYELVPGGALAKNVPMSLRLLITENGQPVARLEPIMGTYAHLVAFAEDRQTVSHIHPLGPGPQSSSQLGAAPLELIFVPKTSGTVVMFAQVQLGGQSRFARFVLDVVDPHAAP